MSKERIKEIEDRISTIKLILPEYRMNNPWQADNLVEELDELELELRRIKRKKK
jgi:hypothetical protein